ncbi:hypothetical protein GS551_13490 [Rhodococcus hoagii]|uniref:Uncharacterized protein n=1 Tax=Rhodococcus hoagii TaxID=43767 RepID=A0AAE2W736_RHOHA|nr:hypothetical protein [Prescottella equi]
MAGSLPSDRQRYREGSSRAGRGRGRFANAAAVADGAVETATVLVGT